MTKLKSAVIISALSFGASVLAFSLPVRHLSPPSAAALRQFTASELARYDGTDPGLPIYLALDTLVYDVTSGRQFYAPGGPYHDLAGKDSSDLLHLAGGDIIKRKYPVVGRLR